MIKLFAFAASCAGEQSHTAKMADTIAEAVRKEAEARGESVSYERLTGDDVRIDYCLSCRSCFSKGICPLDSKDGCTELKWKMLDCDIFLFGNPIYLWAMSGLAKSLLDRISYWAHRFELMGKPCIVFSSTDTTHGPEVAAELEKLMKFTGAQVVNGGCSTLQGMQSDPEETARRALDLYRDPASGVTLTQQYAFLNRVIVTRRNFNKFGPDSPELWDEFKVFRECGYDRYVLLEEAIEALCGRNREAGRDTPE